MKIRVPLLKTIIRWFHRLNYDNASFWDQRYREDPAKGSGPGSRGEHAQLKGALISDALERFSIKSVLDVGCGDVEILANISLPNYRGIDISREVIERNRQKRPDLAFEYSDFREAGVDRRYDLVLCLDVLIHQRSAEDLDRLLRNVLASVGQVGLISGFSESGDHGWNVFFHEPLDKAIRSRAPGFNVERLASYRGTDLYRVTAPE